MKTVGTEWLIDAHGCRAEALRDLALMRSLFDRLLVQLDLHAIGEARWHKFEGEGGVTGLYLLTESHLACHTYPEHRILTLNLYCCRARPEFAWENTLKDALGASHVEIAVFERGRRP